MPAHTASLIISSPFEPPTHHWRRKSDSKLELIDGRRPAVSLRQDRFDGFCQVAAIVVIGDDDGNEGAHRALGISEIIFIEQVAKYVADHAIRVVRFVACARGLAE